MVELYPVILKGLTGPDAEKYLLLLNTGFWQEVVGGRVGWVLDLPLSVWQRSDSSSPWPIQLYNSLDGLKAVHIVY